MIAASPSATNERRPPAGDDRLDTRNRWPRPRPILWYGVAGGPLAWGAQLAFAWLVEGVSCLGGTPAWGPLSAPGVRALQWLVFAVALAIAAGALLVGWRAWRAADVPAAVELEARSRPDFLAAVAVLMSTIFLLAAVWTGLFQLASPMCRWVR